MKLDAFIRSAIQKLRNSGVENPQLDARLLIGDALNLDRAEMLSQAQRALSVEEIAAAEMLLARRVAGEPVARIMGHREFWGLDFGLNEATLEPRPDTETLVEVVLKILNRPDAIQGSATPGQGRGNAAKALVEGQNPLLRTPPLPNPPHEGEGILPLYSPPPLRILDLGTGTGCVLLALLHELPEATGLGIDAGPRAIDQAAINAAALNLNSRAKFRTGNWVKGVKEKFDVIVSNPPYIASSEIPGLMREVREFDPLLALDGGEDGLDAYRALIPHVADLLSPKGLVAFEVGQGQATSVAALFHESGFKQVSVHKDLAGINRCVVAE
ncbi:MAG: peptide chain release factor N(5)-glutamine methyltransferase [Alphaproteobacteria bacterium]|nr:peptide chain release factor N(5)-glutamine methyltransferase [Alphaproteobacteria bacterium]